MGRNLPQKLESRGRPQPGGQIYKYIKKSQYASLYALVYADPTFPRMDSMENFSPGCPPPTLLVRLAASSSLNLRLGTFKAEFGKTEGVL